MEIQYLQRSGSNMYCGDILYHPISGVENKLKDGIFVYNPPYVTCISANQASQQHSLFCHALLYDIYQNTTPQEVDVQYIEEKDVSGLICTVQESLMSLTIYFHSPKKLAYNEIIDIVRSQHFQREDVKLTFSPSTAKSLTKDLNNSNYSDLNNYITNYSNFLLTFGRLPRC